MPLEKTVEQEFQKLLGSITPPGMSFKPRQIKEMRQVFFAGFTAALLQLDSATQLDKSDDEAAQHMQDLFTECHEFFEKIDENPNDPFKRRN